MYGGAKCVWVLTVELASCHLSGAQNFEVALKILRKFVHPSIKLSNITEENHKNHLSVWSMACKSKSRTLKQLIRDYCKPEDKESRSRKEKLNAKVITQSLLLP